MKTFGTILSILLLPHLLMAQLGGKAGIGGKGGSGGGFSVSVPTFTHVSNPIVSNACVSSGGLTCIVTLTNNPATGDTVVCGISTNNNGSATTPTITSWVDANSNAYTATSNSPVGSVGLNGFLFLGYLATAPSNASKTITLTLSITPGGFNGGQCDEFSRSSGTTAVDSVATTSGTSSGTDAITSPTVAVTAANDFLYACVQNFNSIAATVTSPWTANATGVVSSSLLCEYAVNLTSSQAVSFATTGPSLTYTVLAVSFH
jgi:hypothetical protein